MDALKREKILLGSGIAAWLVYLLNLLVLAALWPDYSHISNYVSDLGRTENPYNGVFNGAIILYGTLQLLTGLGFYYSVKRITRRKIISIVVGLSFALIGVGAYFAGIFPLPDELHSGYGIGLISFLIPLFLAFAFSRLKNARIFVIHQILFFVLFVLIFPVTSGMEGNGIINEMNKGLGQRLSVLFTIMWFTSTIYWLMNFKNEK
jgi:hypothetical membrane protein